MVEGYSRSAFRHAATFQGLRCLAAVICAGMLLAAAISPPRGFFVMGMRPLAPAQDPAALPLGNRHGAPWRSDLAVPTHERAPRSEAFPLVPRPAPRGTPALHLMMLLCVVARAVVRPAVTPVRASSRVRSRTDIIACDTWPARILAYGDSLTAGTTDTPDEHPYAPHLEAALGKMKAMVRHRGLPGWTASAMLANVNDADVGLRGLLRKAGGSTDPIDLAILLAGTNDLGYGADADDIVSSLIEMHAAAHELGAVSVSSHAMQLDSADSG